MQELKATISFDIFNSLDIRMCKIESVEDVLKNPKKPPSDDNPVKAYKLLIDTGVDKRECVTNLVGMPHSLLLGQVMPFVLNLPPADIRGVHSRAMIIAFTPTSGKVGLLIGGGDAVPEPGSIVI